MIKDIKKLILETFTIVYPSSSFDRDKIYDLSLSLIIWKVLSDVSKEKNVNLKNILIPSSFFETVMSNLNIDSYKTNILEALNQCDNYKTTWKGIWSLNPTFISSLPYSVWLELGKLWSSFFEDTTRIGKKTNFTAIIDELELLMVTESRNPANITPRELTGVMVNYLNGSPGITLYDPFCRTGNLLYSAATNNQNLQNIHGRTLGNLYYKFTELRMFLLNTKAETFINHDLNEHKKSLIKYDKIISNPPFGNGQWDNNLEITNEWSDFTYKSNRTDVAYLCHTLSLLSDDGRAAILLPKIFLSGNQLIQDLKKKILDSNFLDAVIELPQGLFPHTTISVALFLFNKKRTIENEVFLVDVSKEIYKQGRQVQLNESKINDLIQQIIKKRVTTSENISPVTRQEIEKNNYSFLQSNYKKNALFSKQITPSNQLLLECEELETRLAEIRKSISNIISENRKGF